MQTHIRLLTPAAVAAALGVHATTVRRMIDEHELPAVAVRRGKRERVLRVDERDLLAFVEKRRTIKTDHVSK